MHRPTALLAGVAAAALAIAAAVAAAGPATRPATAPLPATRPADPDPDGLARFPSFGVAFAIPAGWAEVPREKAGRVGQWVGPGSTPDATKQLIMVEAGRPGATSAAAMAQGLARNFGGVVMDDPTTLGGEPALLVRAENHDDELAPVVGLVCVHGDHVFLVMGGTVKGRDVLADVEAVRKSWRWTPVEKPAGHLAFRDKPFAAFAGAVTLNVPAMMHAVPADDPDTQVDLALYNLARNAADFRVTMTLATLGPGESVDDARDKLTKSVMADYKLKKFPMWAQRPTVVGVRVDPAAATSRPATATADDASAEPAKRTGPPKPYLTLTVEADRPQPAETDTLHHQWAVVAVGEPADRVLLIHFTHEAETDEERQAYERAAGRIVDSVTAGKKD